MAYDPKIGLESFCEADLLTLPNGDILCFMRTGGSRGKYTPLYLSVSRDDGKSWEPPRPIADRGVWPSACRMENGVLVVTYGRPDNWLAFSLDNGETWGALIVAQSDGTYSIGNPAPVVDRTTGDIHMLFCKLFLPVL